MLVTASTTAVSTFMLRAARARRVREPLAIPMGAQQRSVRINGTIATLPTRALVAVEDVVPSTQDGPSIDLLLSLKEGS